MCTCCSYFTIRATNYSLDSNDVLFDNTGTNYQSTNAHDAVTEAFNYVTDYSGITAAIGTATLNTTSQNLIGAINEVNSIITTKYGAIGTSTTPYSGSLNDIPLNSLKSLYLPASISPSGSAGRFSCWKSGINETTRYTIFAIDHVNFRIYVYDMYDGTSKGWTLLTENFHAKNSNVPTNTNLNTVRSPGIYMLSASNTYSNMPSGVTGGALEVISPNSNNVYQRQVLYVGQNFYVRTINSSDNTQWSAWYRYSGSSI